MNIQTKENHVLVAGFAQLPNGTSAFEVHKTIGCILIVDMNNDKIVAATFTFLQDLTNRFIANLVKGFSLQNIEEIIQEVESKFIVPPQKAVIQSIIAAKRNYYDHKNKNLQKNA